MQTSEEILPINTMQPILIRFEDESGSLFQSTVSDLEFESESDERRELEISCLYSRISDYAIRQRKIKLTERLKDVPNLQHSIEISADRYAQQHDTLKYLSVLNTRLYQLNPQKVSIFFFRGDSLHSIEYEASQYLSILLTLIKVPERVLPKICSIYPRPFDVVIGSEWRYNPHWQMYEKINTDSDL